MSQKYLTAAAFVASLMAALFFTSQIRANNAVDYYQFWAVGQAVKRQMVGNVYSKQGRRWAPRLLHREFKETPLKLARKPARKRRGHFNPAGTPFLYAVFSLISTGNFDFDLKVFRYTSLTLYLGGLLWLGRFLGMGRPGLAMAPLFFTFFFWPFRVDCAVGNVNQAQVALLVATAWGVSRAAAPRWFFLPGFLLGLGLAFKPNLWPVGAILLGGMAIERRWKELIGMTVGLGSGCGMAFLISTLVLGSHATWPHWYRTFKSIVFTKSYFHATLLNRFYHPRSPIPFLIASFVLLVVPLFILWRRSRNGNSNESRRSQTILLVGLATSVVMLGGPMVHRHYFLLNAPLIMAMVFFSVQEIRRPQIGGLKLHHLLTLGAILLLSFVFVPLSKGIPMRLNYLGVFLLYVSATIQLAKVLKSES